MARSIKDSQLKDNLRDFIFPTNDRKVQQTPEHPSYTMEYKLRHNNYINLHDLEVHLPDMEIDSKGHIITIIGIPPDYDFDKESVLAVVQKYDISATISSHRRL